MEAYLMILVLMLGHPQWRVRDAAFTHLKDSMRQTGGASGSALWIVFAGEGNKDPEIAARCKLLVDGWYRANAGRMLDAVLDGKPCPWIAWKVDGGWTYGHTDGFGGYRPYGASVNAEGSNGPDFPGWRGACREWLLDLVRNRRDVSGIVTELRECERKWKEH